MYKFASNVKEEFTQWLLGLCPRIKMNEDVELKTKTQKKYTY